MSELTVAARYAQALIDIAEEQNSVEVMKDDMELFHHTLKVNSELKEVLANPIISHSKKTNSPPRRENGHTPAAERIPRLNRSLSQQHSSRGSAGSSACRLVAPLQALAADSDAAASSAEDTESLGELGRQDERQRQGSRQENTGMGHDGDAFRDTETTTRHGWGTGTAQHQRLVEMGTQSCFTKTEWRGEKRVRSARVQCSAAVWLDGAVRKTNPAAHSQNASLRHEWSLPE